MKFYKKHETIINLSFILALTAVCLSLAFSRGVWLDEALSMRWSRLGWGDMFRTLSVDVHPPLHYIILKVIIALTGGSLFAAKLQSVLWIFLMLLIGITFVKKNFGYRAMVFHCLFFFCMPFMLQKTVEVRMYTLAAFFTVAAGMQMYHLLKSPSRRGWVLFTICALASAYSHYYSLIGMIFVYGCIFLYFLVTKNRKEMLHWLFCCIATVIGYLPWLTVFLNQLKTVSNDYWIKNVSSLKTYIYELFGSDIYRSWQIYLGIILIGIITLLVQLVRKKSLDFYWAVCMILPFWGTMAFGVVYSTLVEPIFLSRYLIMAVCMMGMGLGVACRYLPKAFTILCCLFFLIVGISVYPRAWAEEYATSTNQTLTLFEEHEMERDVIVYNNIVNSVLMYYLPDATFIEESETDPLTLDVPEFWFFDGNESPNVEALKLMGRDVELIGEDFGIDHIDFKVYRVR